MRELLAAVESPSSNLDTLMRKMESCEVRTPRPPDVIALRETCSASERTELDAVLRRIIDLNAILSATAARATEQTSMALEKARAVRRSLDALTTRETVESTLDCQS